MASIIDFNDPSFVRFPVNNNRTAWRPIKAPMLLVVPHYTTAEGVRVEGAEVFDVRVYIEDVPQIALVAGHDHIGLRSPDRELYAIDLDAIELSRRIIDPTSYPLIGADGVEKSWDDAENGDQIRYTTHTGITDTIDYLIGAAYYDLSDVEIEVENLPTGDYNLSYIASYFKRIANADNPLEFLCIDENVQGLALQRFSIQHPGKIIDEFHRLTPPWYLNHTNKAEDTSLGFYRPFTDALQDVMDEQDLLQRINWVFNAPAEVLPYLSSLLGWDIPYFPKSLDNLRRAVLRRTVEFQNLKGSKKAIVGIFRLFGFEILISNLWWSVDGKRLIRPDQSQSADYDDQEIISVPRKHTEVSLKDYTTIGFNTIRVPLIYTPQIKTDPKQFSAIYEGGGLTVYAYVVDIGGEAHQVLEAIASSLVEEPGESHNIIHVTGSDELSCETIEDAIAELEIIGSSKIFIPDKSGSATEIEVGGFVAPLSQTSVFFDRPNNAIDITLNGHLPQSGQTIYIFTAYTRYEYLVPEAMQDLQSNRFDIQILTDSLQEYVDPEILEFTIDFLYRLKAFHSLLNVIRTRADLSETYLVTDMCAGGNLTQRYDTDFGKLQVPPAIIPGDTSADAVCSRLDAKSLGYKDSDIVFRKLMLNTLPEEHAAWKAYDDREQAAHDIVPTLEPNQDRTACLYNEHGQDRITGGQEQLSEAVKSPQPSVNSNSQSALAKFNIGSSNIDLGWYGNFLRELTTAGDPLCELDGSTDYCYKGRVRDTIEHQSVIDNTDAYFNKPCHLGAGVGLYWTYPVQAKVVRPGVKAPLRSSSDKMILSGNAKEVHEVGLLKGIQAHYLQPPYNVSRESKLGRAYRQHGIPGDSSLHYTNRSNAGPSMNPKEQIALEKVSLEIQLPTMHLPGCRFPTMNALEEDYVSTYEARPWDRSFFCGPPNSCDRERNYLNAHLVTGADGNEHLVFDDERYTNVGNGLTPDISTLGEQAVPSGFQESDVVHRIYTRTGNGHPAISSDNVDSIDTTDDVFITTDNPLFNSYVVCGTNAYKDFKDGYPSSTGYLSITDQDLGRDGLYDEVLEAMGLTLGSNPTESILFTCGSGLRTGLGHRLDCGCLIANCDETDGMMGAICSIEKYRDEDGNLDWNPDKLQLVSAVVSDEIISGEEYRCDGTITTLLETTV